MGPTVIYLFAFGFIDLASLLIFPPLVLCSINTSISSISVAFNSILALSGTNFKVCKENLAL